MVAGTSALRQEVSRIISSQKQPTVTILSSLLTVQEELGYIPEEAIEEIATFCHDTINDVWGVASFYTNFRFSPPGRNQIEACWGPTCYLRGAGEVVGTLQEALGLSTEGDTEDMSFSLRYSTCLGACAQAPVISVNHRLMGHFDPQKARDLIGDLDKR